MKLITAVALIVFAILSGYFLFKLENAGFYNRWEQLPQIPGGAVEIKTIDFMRGFIETEEGALFFWDEEAWVPTDRIGGEDPYNLDEIISNCDFSSIEFLPTSHPPEKIADCLMATWSYAEFGDKMIYVVQDDGSIWRWHLRNGAFGSLFLCIGYQIFAIGASVAVIFVATLIGLMKKSISHPERAQIDD